MDYELIVLWDDGSKDIWNYATLEEVEQAVQNMKFARGKQVAWYEARRRARNYVEKRLGQEDM